MFKVKDKETKEWVTVYLVREVKNCIQFLIYEDGMWLFVNSMRFEEV